MKLTRKQFFAALAGIPAALKADEPFVLQQKDSPLSKLMGNSPIAESPSIQWDEKDFFARWATFCGSVMAADTHLTVSDMIVRPGDLIMASKNISRYRPECMLVLHCEAGSTEIIVQRGLNRTRRRRYKDGQSFCVLGTGFCESISN